MITSLDFGRVKYKEPKFSLERDMMEKIIGIDSEAYTDGVPFMFATSLGEIIKPQQFPDILFEPRYIHANFVVFNLKYDSGAFLYHLPRHVLTELWDRNEVKYEGYKYKYINKKLLRISRGFKDYVSFWDISQFYKSSLDKASQTYLKKSKLDMRTKKFSRKYVKRFWNNIGKYCIQDAKLTAELGVYLVNKLQEFDITASSLYSCASISFQYFANETNIVTGWRFWNNYKKLVAMACDSYAGGKFEITSRGRFHGYEYDITSAYPHEIKNLIDISEANILYSPKYQKDASYGFLRVLIHNYDGKHLPCGIMRKQRIFPAGAFYATITKEEYEYITSIGIEVEIYDGAWVFANTNKKPYAPVIDKLFKIKSDVKGKDRMLYNMSKTIMNSFYGKCVQCIEDPDKNINIGAGWNPIYGSVITANTRIKIAKMQNILQDDCLAVHTDSIISTKKLNSDLIKTGLGEFCYETEGDGIIIASGMYQLGNQCAYRGFIAKRTDDWFKILSRKNNINKTKITYKQLYVESWVDAMAKGHPKSKINVFENRPKEIDLNCDCKRLWDYDITARDLLKNLYRSMPVIITDTSKPISWRIKYEN